MNIFKGILKGNSLKQINDQQFNNNIWEKKISKKIKLNKIKYQQIICSSPVSIMFSLLYLNKKVKILDFGAGDLDIYFQLNELIKRYKKLNNQSHKKFNVKLDLIELPKILKIYKTFKFSKNFNCRILKEFKKSKYDIINISNSLHYVDKPKKFLKKISNTNSKFIVLNSTRIGEHKTFISLQKYYEHSIPTWFFNLNEIIKCLRPKYELIFYSDYLEKIFGKWSKLPMKNFPKKLRSEHCKTLIFKKI
tara:strand:- start:17 stop:763 length:747 start_codon:yes stop_codon:yes gene_type:complete